MHRRVVVGHNGELWESVKIQEVQKDACGNEERVKS